MILTAPMTEDAPKTKPPLGKAIVLSLGITAAAVGALKLIPGPRYELSSTCPAVDGAIAFVVRELHAYEDGASYDAWLTIVDPRDGRITAQTKVSSYDDPQQRVVCLGRAGDQRVWLYGPQHGLSQHDLQTGAMVVSPSEVTARVPELAAGLHAVGWDFERDRVVAQSRDARVVTIDGALEAERSTTQIPSMHGLRHPPADAVVRADVVAFYNGLHVDLPDGHALDLQGHPRARISVDGRPVGDATRDFYLPSLVRQPATGSVIWSDPESLLVIEETAIGSLTYMLRRVGLDGTERYAIDPGEALPGGWMYRPVPWTAHPDGDLVLHFGANTLQAFDVRTGQPRWRTDYGRGHLM